VEADASCDAQKATPARQCSGRSPGPRRAGSTGIRERGTPARGCPGTWEISTPRARARTATPRKRNAAGASRSRSVAVGAMKLGNRTC